MFISLVLALKSKGPETSAHGVHVRQKKKKKERGKKKREEENKRKRGRTRREEGDEADSGRKGCGEKCEINQAFTIFLVYPSVYFCTELNKVEFSRSNLVLSFIYHCSSCRMFIVMSI